MKYGTNTGTGRRAFTLIALLVVIAIIALLISILLPALSNARKVGQATKCGANLHSVGQAAAAYLSENNGVFPPSYVYPDQDGNWGLDQNPSNPYGYIHWSYFFYSGGQAPETAFQCPTMPNGGHPRTNPGFSGWEDGQADQNGASSPNSLQDRQAIRMAYTGNAAIFPRNSSLTRFPADSASMCWSMTPRFTTAAKPFWPLNSTKLAFDQRRRFGRWRRRQVTQAGQSIHSHQQRLE
ncbi:MAG: hypothetical protein IPK83_05605 [Planctomycetes bacterium]|nr:hypothetical protein [Planctomycetota bacterium]